MTNYYIESKRKYKIKFEAVILKRNLIKLLGGNLRDFKYSMKN